MDRGGKKNWRGSAWLDSAEPIVLLATLSTENFKLTLQLKIIQVNEKFE